MNVKKKPTTTDELQKLVGKPLEAAMMKLPAKTIVHIGTDKGSAFLMIGKRLEYKRALQYGKTMQERFGDRLVVDAYQKVDPSEGVILLIAGSEAGKAWTLEEYEENKKEIRRYE